jgi:hypothetical protein
MAPCFFITALGRDEGSRSPTRRTGSTTELRRALKARFVPYAADRGFAVDERNQPRSTVFRRRAGGEVQMFEVQWDKYGRPRFAVHFGTCPAEGLTVNGALHPPEDTLPTWCPDTGSLRRRRRGAGSLWFRQDATTLQRLLRAPALRDPEVVVDELLAAFSELERYWAEDEVGPHLRLWPS